MKPVANGNGNGKGKANEKVEASEVCGANNKKGAK